MPSTNRSTYLSSVNVRLRLAIALLEARIDGLTIASSEHYSLENNAKKQAASKRRNAKMRFQVCSSRLVKTHVTTWLEVADDFALGSCDEACQRCRCGVFG